MVKFEFPTWVRVVCFLMGSIIIVLGFFLNSQLMSGMAVNASEKLGLSMIGVSLDTTKIIFFTVGVMLVASGIFSLQVVGSVGLSIYVALAYLSLNAAWGYGLVIAEKYEQAAMVKQNEITAKSDAVIAQKLVLESATSNYQALSNQFGSAELAAQAKQNGNKLAIELTKYRGSHVGTNSNGHSGGTVASKIKSCPGNTWYHRNYPQHCNKIMSLEAQIVQNLEYIKGHASFLSARELREAETGNLASLTSTGVGSLSSVFHPLYRALANQYGTTVMNSKHNLTFWIALLLEVSGPFLFALGALAKSSSKAGAANITWNDFLEYEVHRGTILEHFANQQLVLENKSSSGGKFSTQKSGNVLKEKVTLSAPKPVKLNEPEITANPESNTSVEKVTLSGHNGPDNKKKTFLALQGLANLGKKFVAKISP